MSDQNYGRNRESLSGLIEQLEEIFKSQPTVKKRPDGQLVLPVAGVREVLKILFEQANMPPLDKHDEESLEAISTSNPNLELSPSNLLEFVAQLTANISPERRFPSVPRKASPTNQAYILGDRGRTHGRNGSGGSRSSSSDSLELNHYDDPDGTQQFVRRANASGFDARARQRTAPVDPPSSWGGKRPAPASRRRRSDAGSNYGGSDNESSYGYGASSGRRRTSNPVSPSTSFQQPGMMFRPPSRQGSSGMGRYSRPHSRSHSSLDKGGSSSHRSESPDAMLVQYSPARKNSIPIPGMGDDDEQGEGDGQEGDDEAHLIPNPRLSLISFTSSAGDTEEQREALQKALAEVTRRAADTERNLQEQLLAREADIDDIQRQLENTRETISILRKDEKEWRVKERHYVSQINGLEAELNKLQRNLDLARSQHHLLSKQHAEQTAELDKHKVMVRTREGEIRELEHRIDTVEHECEKAGADHAMAEEQVKRLQAELAKANDVHAEYAQQKQENMILKETIDRLRYDLDDLRTAHANDSTKGGSSAPGSAMPTLSRSLGSELLRRLNPTDETLDEGDESDATVEETVEEKVESADGEEDVFQTIITRKRKIVGKGKRVQESVLVDASTQYDEELFKSGEENDIKPIVKVEPTSPRSRLLQLPLEDPPSYHLSELEQSGEETMSILRKWHGVKVLGPLPGGISREAVDDWHALKREMGIKCPIIEEIIEQSEKQANGSQTPRFGFSPIKGESARRYVEGGKRRFYNIYNTYILGGEGASSSTSAQRDYAAAASSSGAISTGKWVVAFGAWSAFLLWVGSGAEIAHVVAPGAPTYTDRALWSSFNALTGGAGEGFGATATAPPVDAVGAVWFVVEKIVRGATEIATRRVAFPS